MATTKGEIFVEVLSSYYECKIKEWNYFFSSNGWWVFIWSLGKFKKILRKCPRHGIPHCIQMETFYNGLHANRRMIVDAATNGVVLAKKYNEAYDIIERIQKTGING